MSVLLCLTGILVVTVALRKSAIDPPGLCECVNRKDGPVLHQLRMKRPRWRS